MAADVQIKGGQLDLPGYGTGNYTVSNIGFAPRALLFWGLTDAWVDGRNTDSDVYMGAAYYNNEAIAGACASNSLNTAGEWNKWGSLDFHADGNTTPVRAITMNGSGSGSGGYFTVNVSSADQWGPRVLNWVAFGGSDIADVALAELTPTSQSYSLGWQADFGIVFGTQRNGAASNAGSFSVGCFDDSVNQWSCAVDLGDNSGTNAHSRLSTDCFYQYQRNASRQCVLTLTSIGSTSINWNYSNVYDSYKPKMLAFRFTNGGKAKVGTFTKPTGTAPQTQSMPPFEWLAYMLATAGKTNDVTTPNGMKYSLGFRHSSQHRFVAVENPNGYSAWYHNKAASKVLEVMAHGGSTPDAAATAGAISGTEPTITWSPNDSNATIIGYWGISNGEALAAPPITQLGAWQETTGASHFLGAPPTGENRLLVVCAFGRYASLGGLTSVYMGDGSVQLTRAVRYRSTTNYVNAEIWYINDAGLEATPWDTVYFSESPGSTYRYRFMAYFDGVVQANPIRETAGDYDNYTNTVSDSLGDSLIGDMVVGMHGADGAYTSTIWSGITEGIDRNVPGGGGSAAIKGMTAQEQVDVTATASNFTSQALALVVLANEGATASGHSKSKMQNTRLASKIGGSLVGG